ncbi:Kinase, NEK [Giardia muris]|uniref:Kinase, NEK n=1 Tax=Giardia muris TaxID=5742 RepID=A0A4Z1SNL4_GIAMU|nr:Kinase, NEK [Giardia muris]|eukprot:TNJ27346.1 Kinase, NEK [Giardia muris]
MINDSPWKAYRQGRELGRGAFGVVVEATCLKTNQVVAIKSVCYATMAKTAFELQCKEINLLMALKHPGIVRLLKVYNERSTRTLHLVMEKYSYGDLRSYLEKRRIAGEHVFEETVWHILEQLASALAYCHNPSRKEGHEYGIIIHRDVKPENILVDIDEKVVFSDFGLSRALEGSRTTTSIAGTPSYLAPEVAKREAYTEKADIWSLGCTIYEICTQELYVRAKTIAELPAMQQKRAGEGICITTLGYSEDLETVLRKMLEYEQDLRPSAQDLLDVFQTRQKALLHPINMAGTPFNRSFSLRIQDLDGCPGSFSSLLSPRHDDVENNEPSSLIAAACLGDEKGVHKYMSEVTKRDAQGRTALMAAAAGGHLPIVQLLVKDEAGLRDKVGSFALQYAYNKGRTDVLKFLAPLEGELQGDGGCTVLMRAIRAKDETAALALIPREAKRVLQDESGNTALLYAVHYGMTSVYTKLVDMEAGVASSKGWTALMEAARQDRAEMVKGLLKKEARMMNAGGITALMAAADKGALRACTLLAPLESKMIDKMGETALIKAARCGTADVVKLLLKDEAGVPRSDGKTALMCAAEANKPECVSLLLPLEGGKRKSDGRTALFFAIESGHECIPLLAKAEGKICMNNGIRPEDFARAKGFHKSKNLTDLYNLIAENGTPSLRRSFCQ